MAQFTNPFRGTLRKYKEEPGYAHWATIFGRLLVGWLESNQDAVRDIDFIIGNPTFAERQPLQHIEAIMTAAYTEDTRGRWPISQPDKPWLVKPKATPTSKDKPFVAKEEAAWLHALAIERTWAADFSGKRILVVDDVCTTGLQLNYLAYRLRGFRAATVNGLVLARVPWRTDGGYSAPGGVLPFAQR